MLWIVRRSAGSVCLSVQADDRVTPPGWIARIAPHLSGWMFLTAGLTLLAVMVLLPPADDLARLQHQRDELAHRERAALDRLRSYATFLDAVESEDADLVRRLAAAQLNRIPANAQPVSLIGSNLDASFVSWIEATVPQLALVGARPDRDTWLRRMAGQRYRMWCVSGAMVLMLIGLLPRSGSRVRA